MNRLNPEQAEAAMYTGGPILILAAAGSGKTRVLTYRIAYLIEEAGVSPWSILAITFTNKAAREMKTRVETLIPETANGVWISTFHSACIRILRRDIERIGFLRSFTICDYDDQISLIKECIRELNLDDKQFVPKSMLEQIGRAKDEMITPEQYAKLYHNDFRRAKVSDIYSRYQQKLYKSNSLDFDDIILMTIKLFEQEPDVLAYYQNKFVHVLVDEYQDTNTAQYRLVMMLSTKWRNLCVVGDDDQSIYGWRGANIANILNFEKDFGDAKVVKLEQNYRSTKLILDAANSVILKNRRRKAKKMWTQNGSGELIGRIEVSNEYEEAGFVADRIRRLQVEEGLCWNSFSILYRINAQSRAMENALIREGIPYRIVGGFKFFDRKEIKDVIAYLRLIQNPSDDISFKRIINVPKRGIGAASVEKLESIAQDDDGSLFLAAQNVRNFPELKSASAKIEQFVSMMESFIAAASTSSVTDLLSIVLDKTGIQKELKLANTEESAARLENILELKSEVVDFERTYRHDEEFFAENQEYAQFPESGEIGGAATVAVGLSEFLMHISLVSDIDSYEEEEEKVSLMTVHSAKGLEFDTVFLIGAEEGVFPGNRAMADESLIEEERRLCYVAITRAMNRLCITNAQTRTIFGNTTYNRLSRFIEDIPEDIILGNLRLAFQTPRQRPGYFEKGPAGASPATAMPGAVPKSRSQYQYASSAGQDSADFFRGHTTRAAALVRTEKEQDGFGRSIAKSDRNASQDINEFAAQERKQDVFYTIGERVRHKKYGEGVVVTKTVDKDDVIIEIEFIRAGIKRFIESMIVLEKL